MGLLGPKVTLTFVGDSKDLERKMKSVEASSEGLGAKFGGVAKGVSLLAAAGGGLNIIGGAVGAVTALSGAALLIPGAALAGATAMATLKLATKGFGDAVGAGLTGDVKAFGEATKDMAPAMKEAVGAVVALKPQIDSLKKDVQGEFWDGFSSQITKVGTKLLPLLDVGLSNVSRSLGGVALHAVNAMGSPFFRDDISTIMNSTADAVGNVDTGVGNLMLGFVGLGAVGSTYLPALGTAINDVAQKFYDWTAIKIDDGSVKGWIDRAIAGFQQLSGIVGNVVSFLGSVFTGLGGQITDGLGSLYDFTAALADMAASTEGQAMLQALGEAMRTAGVLVHAVLISAIQTLIPIITALAPVVTSVATALAGWAPVLGPLVVGIFGLVKVFQGVSAALGFYNAVMDLAKDKTVIAVAETVGSWIAMAASAVANAAVMAASWIVAMGPIGWAIAAIVALAALIFFNWDAISAYTAQAWTAITGWISGAWDTVTATVSAAVDAVVGFLAALPGQVLGFLTQLPMMAAAALGTLAGYVYLGAVAAWNFLWTTLPDAVNAAITWLIGLPGMVFGALASLASTVMGIAASAWQGFVSTSISVGSSVLSFVASVPGRVGSFLSSLPGILMSAATSAWRGFLSASQSGGQAALSFIGSLPGRIMSFFSNAGSWLMSAGANIVNGLINGLRNAAQAVFNYIADLGRQIAASFAAAVGIHSPSKVFAAFGVNIGEGLVVGIKDITPAAVGSAVGMASAVTAGAGAALDPFANLGSSVNVGEGSGVSQDMIGKLMAAGWKGDPNDGKEALYRPAAQAVATATDNGVNTSSRAPGVTVTFAGNTSDALATVIMGMIRTGKIQIKAA